MRKLRLYSGLFLLSLMTVSLGSCSQSDSIEPNNSGVSNTPAQELAIHLNRDASFSYSVVGSTRGTGVFDKSYSTNDKKLENATFYVYAFRTHYYTQGVFHEDLMTPADFRRYFKADPTSASGAVTGDPNNFHCLVDGKDYYYGMPMKIRFSGGKPTDTLEYDKSIYGTLRFNHAYPTLGYNFFAYYLDDVDKSSLIPHREADRVYYDSLKIDGTQDILCGMAPMIDSKMLVGKFTDNEKQTILQTDGYSSYAATRNIYPHIRLNHQLARLKFYAFPRNEKANGLVITNVKVRSPYKGEFTVAARDTSMLGVKWSEDTKEFLLHDKSVDGVASCSVLAPYSLVTWDATWMDEMKKQLQQKETFLFGGDMLLAAPAQEYVLDIEYQKGLPAVVGGADAPRPFTFSMPLRVDGGKFEMGKEYNVLISVFGPEEIGITVNLSGSGWERGTLDPIDFDEEF